MDEWVNVSACTVPTVERPVRQAELDELFEDVARGEQAYPCHIRLHLRRNAAVISRAASSPRQPASTSKHCATTSNEASCPSRIAASGATSSTRAETDLQSQARTKLAEVEQRIVDLQAIRATLLATLEFGCEDLTTCASSDCWPLPFAETASQQ